MWKLTSKLPNPCTVAVSGGADSMALLYFVGKTNRNVTAAIYDHGTGMFDAAYNTVKQLCDQLEIELFHNDKPCDKVPAGQSPECYWRDKRYEWLSQFDNVVTAHNLDDVVETWLWSTLHGTPKLIPTTRNNVSRPLLAVSKKELLEYCDRNAISYVNDPSNEDFKYTRPKVRHKLIPVALEVHSGLYSTIRNKVIKEI